MSTPAQDDQSKLLDETAALRTRVEALEEQLRRRDADAEAATLQAMLDAIPVFVSYIGQDLRYRLVNRAYVDWFARPREEIEGRSLAEVQGEDNYAAIRDSVARAAAGEEVHYVVRMTDGQGRTSRVFDTRYLPRRLPGGGLDGFFVLSLDVTAERQAAEALRLIQFAIDHAPECMYTISPEGRLLAVNDAACQRLEYSREELLGLRVPDIDPDMTEERWREAWEGLRRDGRTLVEARHRSKSGRPVFLEISAAHFEFEGREYCCAFGHDLTKRRAAEERLRQAERLAAVGTLAAGIAHELNNPLGLILLEAEDALAEPGDRAAMEQSLRSIVGNVQRCASIVKGVLQFARRRSWDKGPVDVNTALRRAVAQTQEPARRAGVSVTSDLQEGLPQVLGNTTALEQVIINLIQNAVRASAAGQAVVVRSRQAGSALLLVVQDQGRGMTEEEQRRAFDPFYSTHYSRGGTGLGLSIAHGIVEDHRGTIQIESALGLGSTLTVRLPVGEAYAAAGQAGAGGR